MTYLKNFKGFTITEILLVIAIISILVFFAMIEYSGSKSQFEKKKVESDLANIKKAMSMYAIQNEGVLPTDFVTLKNSGIIEKIPVDPWGKRYQITIKSNIIYVGSYTNGTVEVNVGAR
ncbi:MAG: prepilin-type N-terminal cleavage/methylation domain-containing protein [Candidatus Muirbacterium halophilum]|nr:prepilin-type N-terminal cleavage/methylation domain-containing protein [Candidatus Muirbacterium halophilum]MCK9475302.1 prepilin-type N-terminal cleavage/methylation domain-containing protein [Candidatus Muirbacterium halophilum]